MSSPAGASAALAFAALSLLGCGAGAPLLHPAHVLNPGDVSVGAGLSGQLGLTAASGSVSGGKLAQITAAPGIAPWVSGRFGIAGDNEAGLSYTGRALRLDVRHAFALGTAALSIGLGGSVLAPLRPGDADGGSSVFGGGVDVPVLFGVHSKSDLYALWIGPRGGFEALSGQVSEEHASARHFFGGFVVGVRGGFRHLHAAIELDGAYHRADGTLAGAATGVGLFSLTPTGALLLTF